MSDKVLKLGDVISFVQTKKIQIQDEVEYTIAGVQSYGKGILNRRKEFGKNMVMKQYQFIDSNCLMWCKVDTKNGAFGITKNEHVGSLASSNMCLAKINTDKILPDFLEKLFRIKFFHENITHLSSGTTNRKYLTPSQLCELVEIPNLDIEKQQKFLDFVNKLENSPIFTNINHQLTLIENLNQAILQEAVQGKLVPQDPTDEPASQLLERIKAEKDELIKDKKIKQGKLQNAEVLEELIFEIPETWAWCKLDDICYNITDGTHQTPNYTTSGRTFLSAQNIKPFRFMPEEHKYVSEEAYQDYIKNRKPEKGDILIARVGAGIGEAAVIDREIEFCFYVSLGLIQPFKNYVDSKYLTYVINSKFGIRYAKGNISSQGAAGNFNLGRIRSFPIPLPPLSEQQRIVAEIERQLAKTKELKANIEANQQATEQLLKALLHGAFAVEEKE